MNLRTASIPFLVVCVVLFLFLISVYPVHAGNTLTIAEPAQPSLFELSDTVMTVHRQSDYLTAGERMFQLAPFQKEEKQTGTIVITGLINEEISGMGITCSPSHQVIAGLVALKQKISKRLLIVAGSRHEIDDYSIGTGVPERRFDFYQADAEIAYQITKRLSAGISFTYTEKERSDNNFTDYEYENNQTIFNITGSF